MPALSRIKTGLLLAFIIVCFSFHGVFAQGNAPDLKKIFKAESFMLDNGMQVVVIPNHRTPVVMHMVWYKVGAADEKPGQSGLAHFVEHLMFKGTEKVPSGEFVKRVKALGGNHNAFTNKDYTAYFQFIAKTNLETVMEMEADRMTNLVFPPEDVLSERDVVIEERRERTENDPRGYFYEQMYAALFPNHPYANPTIGWFHELDALDRDHVMEFYKTWYAPNNAILIMGGDITTKEAKPLAEKTYGKIPRRDVPERHWTSVPPLIALQNLTLHDPVIRQPVFSRIHRVPSYNQDKETAMALYLLQEIMSGGASTRLYKTLVVEQLMATNASMGYDGAAYSDGTVSFSVVPADDVSKEEIEWALNEVVRKVIKEGVTEAELEEAKIRIKEFMVYTFDNVGRPPRVFGENMVVGMSLEDLLSWPELIDSVTTERVQQAAATYLDPDDFGKTPYVTGYMAPPLIIQTVDVEATPTATEEPVE